MPPRAALAAAICALAFNWITPAGAQSYPAKAIRVVVPIAPAGSTDIVGRLMAQRLSERPD